MSVKRLWILLAAVVLLAAAVGAAVLPAQARLGAGQTAAVQTVDNRPSVIFGDDLRGQIDLLRFSPVGLQAAVPSGATDGPVVVMRGNQASNPLTMTVGSPDLPDLSGMAASWQITVTGNITESAVWSQHALLDGLVVIQPGVTITITPGTTIFGGPGAELRVMGNLLAEGEVDAPIFFTSAQAEPAPGDWNGVLITKESETFSLKYGLVEYAENGLYFRANMEGHAYLSGTVSHSVVQHNRRGMYNYSRPDKSPYNHTVTAVVTFTHNLVQANAIAGVTINTSVGGGWAKDYSFIAHNRFEGNQIGVELIGNSWWIGHTDHRPIIHNNWFSDNVGFAIDVRGYGSSDSSGSDTRMYPIITHNLLENGAAGLRLYLNPRGSDGVQIVWPTVHYNSFRDLHTAIVMEDVQPYDTLTADIAHNVFHGFDAAGSYAIFNPTARPLTADDNYWGADAAAWALGATPHISGTVTVESFLTADDPPVLTHVAPGAGLPGDWLAFHGANFGELARLFLPYLQK
jgi:hypothetical protein